ncbi:MAG: tetratricopeptide repeat protein [Verrucomicrobiota bacterium]
MKHPFPLRPALALAAALSLPGAGRLTAADRGKAASPTEPRPASVEATRFAPVPADHPLASVWNDPEFTRRLLGSYGFLSEAEPRLNPEEQKVYREKIVPLLREDPRKAVPELEKLTKPEASALFDFTLGNILFQSDDLTNAIVRFEAALAKFPDFRRAQKNLGLAQLRAGNYEAAIKPLSRTASLGGADSKTYGLLGFAQMNLQRYASAEAAYRQALLFEPDNLDFRLGLVKCLIAQASYDGALALLDELIRQFPDRDTLWALQANVFIQKDQPARATVNFEILRRMGKATAAQLFTLGDLYLAQEIKDLALKAYLDGIEKDGGANPAKALRAAELLVARGALPEAGQVMARLQASPTPLAGPEELRLMKLEARAAFAAGRGEEAIAVLERIAERNPLDGEALLLAGDHYARHGQREKALLRYESAGRLEGFEADALLKQAQLKVQGQKYAEAVELLRKAQKARPRDNVQRYLERVEQLALRTKGA